jgi:hypothetical protein
MEHRWNDAHGKNLNYSEKDVPVPLCPPQIAPPHSDRPTNNRLSHGTAVMIIVMMMITVISNTISNADKNNIMYSNILECSVELKYKTTTIMIMM